MADLSSQTTPVQGEKTASTAGQTPLPKVPTKSYQWEALKVQAQPAVETYAGIKVDRPFKWLSSKSGAPILEKLTQKSADYFSVQAEFEGWQKAIESLIVTAPPLGLLHGDNYFYQEKPAIIKSKNLKTGEEVLILDLNKDQKLPGATKEVALANFNISSDGKKIAFWTGTLARETYFFDLETKKLLPDILLDTPARNLTWSPDGSEIYYTRHLNPKSLAKNDQEHRKVWLHRFGTSQDKDALVFGADLESTAYPGSSKSKSGDWILYVNFFGRTGSDIFIKHKSWKEPKLLLTEESHQVLYNPIWDGERLIVQANDGKGMGRAFYYDLNPNAVKQIPRKLINEIEHLQLMELKPFGNESYLAHYIDGSTSVLKVLKKNGQPVKQFKFPEKGTINAINSDGGRAVFSYSSFITPPTIFSLDASDFKFQELQKTTLPAKINPAEYVTETISVKIPTGKKIPVNLLYKRNLAKDAPAVLFAYGGFNIPATPVFNQPILLAMAKAGAVIAVPTLPGDGGLGEQFHRLGMGEGKELTIAANQAVARELLKRGAKRIAAYGGSNGGLVTLQSVIGDRNELAAKLSENPLQETRRPLFVGAAAVVPITDLLHTTSSGYGKQYKDEYGDPEKKKDVETMIRLSPLRQIRESSNYPPVLLSLARADAIADNGPAIELGAALQNVPRNPSLTLVDGREGEHSSRAVSRNAQVRMFRNIGLFLGQVLELKAPEF